MAETPRNDMESWRNATLGTHFISRLDHRGEMVRVEQIGPGRTFHLTPEERRINSERTASEDLDVFRNGFFEPVRLLDDSEEARELASNPNVMSESDMRALVKVHPKTFDARLQAITNGMTLERLAAIALDEDVTVKRMRMIQGRLAEVSPSLAVTVQSTVDYSSDRKPVFGQPVTPR
jgi:hypothetical protein